jgi:leucyl-tRNA synthetase
MLTRDHYAHGALHKAVVSGFWDLQTARNNYRLAVGRHMNRQLVERFIEVQTLLLAPICPHYCDYIWSSRDLLGRTTQSVLYASWPVAGSVDALALEQSDFLHAALHTFRVKAQNTRHDFVNTDHAYVYVSDTFPWWHQRAIAALVPLFNAATGTFRPDYKKAVVDMLKGDAALKPYWKKLMSLVAAMPERIERMGPAAFSTAAPFDQLALLEEHRAFLEEQLGIGRLTVVSVSAADALDADGQRHTVAPLRPAFTFVGEKRHVNRRPHSLASRVMLPWYKLESGSGPNGPTRQELETK